MQVQQLTDLNVSGAKQAEVNKTAKSSVVEADDRQQDNTFKDQFDKQIDQSKTQVNKENKHKNQDDSVETKSDELSAEEPDLARDGEPAITAEALEKNGDSQATIEEDTAKEEVSSGEILKSDMLPVGIQNVEELPENGKPLPLSDVPEKAVAAATALVAPSATNVDKVSTASVEQVKGINILERVAQNLDKPVDVVAASAKAKTQLNSEVGAAPAVYKAVNPGERLLNVQGIRQQAPVMSEMPAAEAVTQSTRLQQVVLSTAINASTSTAQNINTAALNPLTEINTTLTSSNPVSNSLSSTITTQLQSPQWSQKVTEQVSFMLKGGFQQAEIKLNPAHLGPMEIKLAMNDDQASVSFVAQHAPVREALDSAIPRLREMLEQQGINLADVDVSSKSQQQSEDGAGDAQRAGLSDEEQDVSSDEAEIENIVANLEIDSGVSIYA